MIFSHKQESDTVVIAIEGNIALDGVNEAKAYMKPHLDNPDVKGLLLNFEKVNFIDSSGIGLIVSIFKTMQEKNGKLVLTNLSKKNEEIFSITRLNKILDIFPTEAEGVASLVPGK
jgi:anti-anti-sigma factor